MYSYFTRGLRWIKDKLLFFDFSDLLNYLKKSEGEYDIVHLFILAQNFSIGFKSRE
nr:hypothetical protein [Holospora elegans]